MFEIKPSSTFILKKRCLLIVLVLALFVILANVGITALLMYYVNVSKQSIGAIRLNQEHTLINGKLFVDRNVFVDKILAFNTTLHFLSQKHIYLESRNGINGKSGSVHLDRDIASISAKEISFRNIDGDDYLYISKDSMEVNVRRLDLKGKARSIPSIQTESILSSPLSNIRISSPTRNAEISSAKTLRLNSFGGQITIDSLDDIHFETSSNISLDSKDIFMPKILGNRNKSTRERNVVGIRPNKSYELCVCGNNRKMFASNDGCMTAVGSNQNGKELNELCL